MALIHCGDQSTVTLPWLQKPDTVVPTAAEADSDEESAADMEEFEDSGMLDADDPVSVTLFLSAAIDVTWKLKQCQLL